MTFGDCMYFSDNHSLNFISDVYNKFKKKILDADELLKSKKFQGSEMLGWQNLDINVDNIAEISKRIVSSSDCVIVIGIGGSYLGSKMAIDFINPIYKKNIYFLGHHLDSEYICNVLQKCENKSIHVIVISKSGNTVEIKVTLDIILKFMKKRYNDIKNRFTSITGKNGYLRTVSEQYGWEILDIPDNVGGRFSVMTNAGLLPIAVSGANIKQILNGAIEMQNESLSFCDCHKYALIRNALYSLGFKVELFSCFNSRLVYAIEWIKQLFGESEGKNNKGIFPSSAFFSTDLHSIGQFIQEGSKILFESVIFCDSKFDKLIVSDDFIDEKLRGLSFDILNDKILKSVMEAHCEGGVPCNLIKIKDFSEYTLGKFIYFFEFSCAISAISLGVNPFNQPGVEVYKKFLVK